MVSMDRLLLTGSGKGQTEAMLKILMEIPLFKQSHVTVLHVVPPKINAEKMAQRLEEGKTVLAETMRSLKLDSSKSNAVLKEGDPKDIVCRVAEEIDANLIIMGSRGLNRIQSILENSTSQYVFQLVSRPMLLVKDGLFLKKIRKVLITLDKSDASKQALNLALSMVKGINGGQIIFVHVTPDLSTIPIRNDRPAEQNPILAPAVEEAQRLGVKYTCEAPVGPPGARIQQLAEDLDVDLIVMGSQDRRPPIARKLPDFDRLFGNSLSDYIRINAPCPLLLIR